MGGFFALAGTATINDVFFVHERGLRVGLWNLASIASINIAPIISGYVIVNLGWRWAFWLMAITFGVVLLFTICFFPETTFDRAESAATTKVPHPQKTPSSSTFDVISDEKSPSPPSTSARDPEPHGSINDAYLPWTQTLCLSHFKIRNQSQILRNLATPFLILRSPAVLWACAMWSVVFSWLILQSAVAQQIFGAAPYNMSSIEIGVFIGVAPLIGSVIGTVFGGFASDLSSKWMAARNDGIYEPEFRLVIMIPFIITWVVGIFGLGIALDREASSIVCGVFLAILGCAVGVGCTGIVAYSNDVCQNCAGESFGIAMLIKSAFAFGLTFMLNDYYATNGPKIFMFTWGSLTVGVTLFTVPLYIFGKKSRSWCARKGIM